jgi:hypoxanthine-guanine phosphoribosyltransferase
MILDQIPDQAEINEIFDRITDRSRHPVPIGTRCESNVYYRVQSLNEDDLDRCALFVADQLRRKVKPHKPELFLKLPGGYSFFAERLCAVYSELWDDSIEFEQYIEANFSNGYAEKFKGKSAVLITDVITTARSSLETHTKATIRGIKVICWATLIDRTLGPGPVNVVSALVGSPVTLLTGF